MREARLVVFGAPANDKGEKPAPVAQWIEQWFPKPRVGRSSRLGGTNFQ